MFTLKERMVGFLSAPEAEIMPYELSSSKSFVNSTASPVAAARVGLMDFKADTLFNEFFLCRWVFFCSNGT